MFKSGNLHIVLLIFFPLSVIKLREQWISSTGIGGAVVSDLVALDSSLFICASNSGEMTGFQVPDLLKYTNPAIGFTSICIDLPASMTIHIAINDIAGRNSGSVEPVNAVKGNNKIPINLTAFKPGMYLVSVTTNKNVCTQKLMVIK